MRTFANVALGVTIGSAVAYLVIHRKVVVSLLTGQPIPEPPAWHKKFHPCLKG